jgi:hypothetical protein
MNLKINWKLVLLLSSAVVALIFLVLKTWDTVDDSESLLSETMGRAERIAFASEEYFAAYGRWPSNFGTLVSDKRWPRLATNDAWGYRFHYVPHDLARGFGAVISLGSDNKPGGVGTNADGVGFFGGKNYPPSMVQIEDWIKLSSK